MATAPLTNTGGTAASALPAAGGTSEQTLSSYIGPYVTNMLGKAQAIANEPYQVYQGPMTAGASNLQNKVFQGLGNLSFPGNLGKSFASPMGGNTNNYGGPGGPAVMPQQGRVPDYAMSGDYTGGKGFGPDTNNPLFAGVGAMPPGGSDLYSPQVMPQQGMRGFNQGPRTEADWKMHSSMALYSPGTDMEKAKADFLAGGRGGPGAMPNAPALRSEETWNKLASMARFPPGTDMEKAKADFLAGGQGGGPVSAGPGAMPPGGDEFVGLQRQFADTGQDYRTVTQDQIQQGQQRDQQRGQNMPQGIAGLTAPQTSQQPSSIAQSYMNPYLESVLAPQMDELRRQSKLNLQPGLAKLTQAGGFGGGRQAIMESEANRNLLSEQNKTVGQGYASAFDKAMGQFNTEQGQSKDLVNMLANAGQAERGIEQEGITADYNEFLAQRDDPMKKTQYLQSMLQGLPISTVTNTQLPKSGIGQLVEAFGGMTQLEDALKKFKLG